MIVSINQPAYLPWLGYFDRIYKSDLHIVLDAVQFEKNSFINRNKVRVGEDWRWLTVPVRTSKRFDNMMINNLEIDNTSNWRYKHWECIRQNYNKAEFFNLYKESFEELYSREWTYLDKAIREINAYIMNKLGINTQILYQSSINVEGAKDDLVLNLCQEVGAGSYLSGPLGKNYIKPEKFQQAGIELKFHEYEHPVYRQYQGGFESCMSVIDLMFNHGEESIQILSK